MAVGIHLSVGALEDTHDLRLQAEVRYDLSLPPALGTDLYHMELGMARVIEY